MNWKNMLDYFKNLLNNYSKYLPENFGVHIAGFAMLFFLILLYCGSFLFGNGHLISHDNLREFYPAFQKGFLLWEPALQLGYPAFADPQAQMFYPLRYFFIKSITGFHFYIFMHLFLAAYFCYLLAFRLTRSLFPSMIAALCFALGGSMIGQMTMLPVAIASSWMPLVLLGFYDLIILQRKYSGIVISAFALAMCFLSGHPQIFVHTVLTSGIFVAFFLIRNRRIDWALLASSCLSLVIGILLCGVMIFPLLELIPFSGRSGALDYKQLNNLQMPFDHLVRLLHPFIFGAPHSNDLVFHSYNATKNFHELHRYFSLLPFFLFPWGMYFIWKKNRRLGLTFGFLTIVFLLMALGNQTPLSYLIAKIPVLNKSRGPARHFAQINLLVSIFTAMGLKGFLNTHKSATQKWQGLAVFLTFILVAAIPFILLGFHDEIIKIYGKYSIFNILKMDIFIVQNILVSFFFLTLLLLIYIPKQRFRKWILVSLVLICFFDLYLNKKYVDWGLNYGTDPISSGMNKEQKQLAALLPEDARHFFYLPVSEKSSEYYLKSFLPWLFYRPNIVVLSSLVTLDNYNPLALGDAGRIILSSWIKLDVLRLYGIDYVGGIYKTDLKPDVSTHLSVGSCASGGTGMAQFLQSPPRVQLNLPKSSVADIDSVQTDYDIGLYIRVLCQSEANQTPELLFKSDGRSVKAIQANSNTNCLGPSAAQDAVLGSNRCQTLFYTLPKKQIVDQIEIIAGSGLNFRLEAVTFQPTSGKKWYFAPSQIKADPLHTKTIFKNENFVLKKQDSLGRAFLVSFLYPLEHSATLPLLLIGDSSASPDPIKEVYKSVYDGKTALIEPRDIKTIQPFTELEWQIGKKEIQNKDLQIIKDEATRIVFKSRADEKSFLVLNQPFYPGWKVYVDGKEHKLIRTNYFVSGVPLEKGAHLVEFVFEPASLWIGIISSLIGLFIFGFFMFRSMVQSEYLNRIYDLFHQAIENHPKTVPQALSFVVYGITGLVSTLVHFLALTLLTEVFKINPVIGTAPAFGVAVVVSYILNSRLVFKKSIMDSLQFVRFFIIAIVGVVLNVALMYVFVEILSIWYIFSFLVISAIVALCTYLLNHSWTFNKKFA